MLGKLFNLGAGPGAGTSPSTPASSAGRLSSLESVQEDIHTRNLLFPDPQDLFDHRQNHVFPLSSNSSLLTSASTNAFDYESDVELDARDVRIIIMQDALGSVSTSVLYDSQAPPPAPASSPDRASFTAGSPAFPPHDLRRSPTSPRKSTSGSQRKSVLPQDSPQSRQGAFDRRPSAHGRTLPSYESDLQRAWREHKEEQLNLSKCIFGNSEVMAYKGTSTKVHILPTEARPSGLSSLFDGSLGRSSMRSSRLSQSLASENVPPFPLPSSHIPRVTSRKRILITRLFPVTLPTDEEPVVVSGGPSAEHESVPLFPPEGEDATKKKKKLMQKKTPMYAIAMVITLPPDTTPRSAFQGSGSYSEQASLSSSLGSSRPGRCGPQPFDAFELLSGGDLEDRMDIVTRHWDVIMRTIAHLHSLVASVLFSMLRKADLAHPEHLPASVTLNTAKHGRAQSTASRQSDDSVTVKPPKSNSKLVALLEYSLLDNRKVTAEIDAARSRIVGGIRATRVVTGQNRWPVWREEARWVQKWAGGREQGFFFFNLLTGFLATHTDWLRALSPPAYRQRYFLQHESNNDEDTCIPARTIIVSSDKMAARRLVFLLSAFLPASRQLAGPRTHRPSTSASARNFSQSPPTFVTPMFKEESLRRKINRRTGTKQALHSRTASMQSQQSRLGDVPAPLAHLCLDHVLDWHTSETSTKTANLAIPGAGSTRRKSSVATIATVTPEMSFPHFSTAHRTGFCFEDTPTSRGSKAAEDLKRVARESATATSSVDSRQTSRWSVISGLWNSRRRESLTESSLSPWSSGPWSTTPSSPVRLGTNKSKPARTRTPDSPTGDSRTGKQEVDHQPSPDGGEEMRTPRFVSLEEQTPPEQIYTSSTTRRIPDPSGAYESPVKTSINVQDGVVDVDIEFPDLIAALDTAASSHTSSGYLSTPGFSTALDSFEQSSRVTADGDSPLNAAGWLPSFHSDFAVQAIPPQREDLVAEVKRAVLMEPLPSHVLGAPLTSASAERWVDVSNVLIADTTNFTVTRIRHRRLVKPKPTSPGPASTSAALGHPPSTPPLGPSDDEVQGEFIEEPIVALDQVLARAVERVVALGRAGTVSSAVTSSGTSSRSTSNRRGRNNSVSSQSTHEQQNPSDLSIATCLWEEVPRSECKAVVLTALEDIVRDAVDERDVEENSPARDGRARAMERESVLRQAVRAWLDRVDLGA